MTAYVWHPISPATLAAAEEEGRTAALWQGSDYDMAPDRYLLGILGERLVAAALTQAGGWPVERRTLGMGPDGGEDFTGTDVKAVRPNAKMLMRLVSSTAWSTYYLVVCVDLKQRRACVLGHTHVSELQAAPVQDLGHGPTYCLPLTELEPGLPPSLVLQAVRAARLARERSLL